MDCTKADWLDWSCSGNRRCDELAGTRNPVLNHRTRDCSADRALRPLGVQLSRCFSLSSGVCARAGIDNRRDCCVAVARSNERLSRLAAGCTRTPFLFADILSGDEGETRTLRSFQGSGGFRDRCLTVRLPRHKSRLSGTSSVFPLCQTKERRFNPKPEELGNWRSPWRSFPSPDSVPLGCHRVSSGRHRPRKAFHRWYRLRRSGRSSRH